MQRRPQQFSAEPLIQRLNAARRVVQNRKVISFLRGDPDPTLFPVKKIADATQSVFRKYGGRALSYGRHEGFLPLCQFLAAYYQKERGLRVDPKHIIITTGSQQGLDLIAKTFLKPPASVLLERPTYVGALEAFLLARPRFLFLDITKDGIDASALQKTFAKNRRDAPSLCYLITNFQNPTGAHYSLATRHSTAEVLKNKKTTLVEDDRYGNLYFGETPLPLLKSFRQNTILLGSFSTLLAPGFRLGWIVATDDTMEELMAVKHASDIQSSHLLQMIAYEYCAQNDIAAHLKHVRTSLCRRRDIMHRAIGEFFPPGAVYQIPQGGYFLWVTIPTRTATDKLLHHAVTQGVSFSPGSLFYLKGGTNKLRLSFAGAREQDIREGIRRLATALRKAI